MTQEQARRIIQLKPDPLGIPRNPLAVYLLCLAFVSGLGMALGVTTSSGAEAAMPHWVSVAWGVVLVHGSGATLTGMYWPREVKDGLLFKRIGMFSLTVAAGMYSLAMIVVFGISVLFTAGIIFGFGAACAVQYHVINERIKAIMALSKTGEMNV